MPEKTTPSQPKAVKAAAKKITKTTKKVAAKKSAPVKATKTPAKGTKKAAKVTKKAAKVTKKAAKASLGLTISLGEFQALLLARVSRLASAKAEELDAAVLNVAGAIKTAATQLLTLDLESLQVKSEKGVISLNASASFSNISGEDGSDAIRELLVLQVQALANRQALLCPCALADAIFKLVEPLRDSRPRIEVGDINALADELIPDMDDLLLVPAPAPELASDSASDSDSE
jgi:hypothetical protein